MSIRRLFAIAAIALCAAAQRPAFEAAAIKPSKDADFGTHWRSRDNRLNIGNMTLKQLVAVAWSAKDFQVSGGPKWADSDRWNIDAKAETAVSDRQLMAMLQTLLAERFQLVLRQETKPMPAYALVVAKGGLKIKPAVGEGSSSNSHNGKLSAEHITMEKLADLVQRQLRMPVVDETGVKDAFSFTLEWSVERTRAGDSADAALAATGPTLFTALPEQLGVKLENRKVQMAAYVLERAEKPSEN